MSIWVSDELSAFELRNELSTIIPQSNRSFTNTIRDLQCLPGTVAILALERFSQKAKQRRYIWVLCFAFLVSADSSLSVGS